jgi:hypothetical protein
MKPERRLLYLSHRISVPALSAYNPIRSLILYISMVCFNSGHIYLLYPFGLACFSTIVTSKHLKPNSHLCQAHDVATSSAILHQISRMLITTWGKRSENCSYIDKFIGTTFCQIR